MKDSQRLFVPADLGIDREIHLDAAQAHYLAHVLRLAEGAEVLLFNGRDGEWAASLTAAGKKGGRALCMRQTRAQDHVPDLHLVFAPIKGDRIDAIAEKATELGVRVLQPAITERTIARKVNIERLRARCIEAAEQTGRLSVPEVRDAAPLGRALADPGRCILFADEAGGGQGVEAALADAPARVALLTGPEGGFTPGERALLRDLAHVRPVSLGPRILRADTAVFAGLALVQSAWGDWRDGAGPR